MFKIIILSDKNTILYFYKEIFENKIDAIKEIRRINDDYSNLDVTIIEV